MLAEAKLRPHYQLASIELRGKERVAWISQRKLIEAEGRDHEEDGYGEAQFDLLIGHVVPVSCC